MNKRQIIVHTQTFANDLEIRQLLKWKIALMQCWKAENPFGTSFESYVRDTYGLALQFNTNHSSLSDVQIVDSKKALIFQIKYTL
jgi:hypothetical protein